MGMVHEVFKYIYGIMFFDCRDVFGECGKLNYFLFRDERDCGL